jgi:anaerobic ribonucleoside-triphosphate reductase activating protein
MAGLFLSFASQQGRRRQSMNLQIQKIHFPITTLGFGERLGIWLQGCSIRCPGCINRDTWDFNGGGQISVRDLIKSVEYQLKKCDGITISGGEPLDQPDAIREFLFHVKNQITGDILMFSGYSKEHIDQHHPWVSDVIDILITDPFDELSGQTKFLRGSDNQRIFLFSEKAFLRYSADINEQAWGNQRRLQVFFENNEVFFAGIPRIGDMDELKILLTEKGVNCKTSDKPNE